MNRDESELEARIKDGSRVLEDYLWLGKIYLERGDYERLLEHYEKATNILSSNEEKARIVYEKGEVLNLLGRKQEAVSCFENSLQFISKEKEKASILYIRGMDDYSLSLLYDEEKGYEYARLALNKYKLLIEKYPEYGENSVALLHLGHLYLKFEEFDKAIEVYRKALETSKDNEAKVWCLCGIASVYREKGDYRKSEENYKEALNIARDKKLLSNIYFEIGKMFFDSSRTENAIEAFDNALNYLKDDPVLRNNKEYVTDIYWHLGTLAYYMNDYDKAIGYLNRTLENIDHNHNYYCNSHITLGHSYVAIGDSRDARQHYYSVLSAPKPTEEEINMVNECLERIEGEYKA